MVFFFSRVGFRGDVGGSGGGMWRSDSGIRVFLLSVELGFIYSFGWVFRESCVFAGGGAVGRGFRFRRVGFGVTVVRWGFGYGLVGLGLLRGVEWFFWSNLCFLRCLLLMVRCLVWVVEGNCVLSRILK